MSTEGEGMILNFLGKLLNSQSFKSTKDIDLSSTDFTPSTVPFCLYVGVSGRIVGVNIDGSPFDRVFIAGYHLIEIKQVTKASTTATNLAALYK